MKLCISALICLTSTLRVLPAQEPTATQDKTVTKVHIAMAKTTWMQGEEVLYVIKNPTDSTITIKKNDFVELVVGDAISRTFEGSTGIDIFAKGKSETALKNLTPGKWRIHLEYAPVGTSASVTETLEFTVEAALVGPPRPADEQEGPAATGEEEPKTIEVGQTIPNKAFSWVGKGEQYDAKETYGLTEVNLKAGKTYLLYTKNIQAGTSADPVLYLAYANGRVAKKRDNLSFEDRNARMEFKPTRSGTYRIALRAAERNGLGHCSLTVKEKQIAPPLLYGEIMEGQPFEWRGEEAQYHPTDNYGEYEVTLLSGITYLFAAADRKGPLDAQPVLILCDDNAIALKKSKIVSAKDPIVFLQYTAKRSGTYFLNLRSRNAQTAGTCSLSFSAPDLKVGSLWSWGRNDKSQLGRGTLTTQDPQPFKVSLPSNEVIHVACGDDFVVTLTAEGQVWTWGNNFYGQTANGQPDIDKTLSTEELRNHLRSSGNGPFLSPDLRNVSAIASGSGHGLALINGEVYGWGNNFDNQASPGFGDKLSTPRKVQGLSGIVAIAAAGNRSAALNAAGTVYTWGGASQAAATPVKLAEGTKASALSIGLQSTFAVTDRQTLWAWGDTSNKSLGGFGSDTLGIPSEVPGLSGIVRVRASGTGSLVLMHEGSDLKSSWIRSIRNSAEAQEPLRYAEPSGVLDFAEGESHRIYLMADGTVAASGSNEFGQLGRAADTTSQQPKKRQIKDDFGNPLPPPMPQSPRPADEPTLSPVRINFGSAQAPKIYGVAAGTDFSILFAEDVR